MDDNERNRLTAEYAVSIHRAAREYVKAYDAYRQADKRKAPSSRKKFLAALGRMKELAAVCELYQREDPEAQEEIAQLLEQLATRRNTSDLS